MNTKDYIEWKASAMGLDLNDFRVYQFTHNNKNGEDEEIILKLER